MIDKKKEENLSQANNKDNGSCPSHKSQETVKLRAGAAVFGGLTISRLESGKIALIQGAIPCELVEISIVESKKNHLLGIVKQIVEPSEDRVSAQCRYFNECGGCHYQHISYKKQVELKQEALGDCMRRIAGIDMMLAEPLIVESNVLNYRHRGRFRVLGNRIGFNRQRSAEIIEIEDCLLMVDSINEMLKKTRSALSKHPHLSAAIKEINFSSGDGCIAYLSAINHSGFCNNQLKQLASILSDCGFHGLCFDKGNGNVDCRGNNYLTLPFGDIKYCVSPMSFFQANWGLNLAMVDAILHKLGDIKSSRILDLYAGAGNFTLPFSGRARHVIAIEENPFAVRDGLRNIEINNMKNIRFINSTVENVAHEHMASADIVLLDPPRAGISKVTIKQIQDSLPETIVIVSCDPPTLARDMNLLSASYEIESLQLVDMFPQTYHMETFAIMRAK